MKSEPAVRQPRSAAPIDSQVVVDALRRHLEAWFRHEIPNKEPRGAAITAYSSGTQARIDKLFGPLAPALMNHPPADVLDVGCGFGSIPVYLANLWPHSQILATDVSDRFYRCGKSVSEEHGLGNITFKSMSVEDIEASEEFDLVMSCNMLNFMNSRERLEDALFHLWRAARPGGKICIYTPHFWQPREPFTKIPLLHFLPVPWQDRIARRLNKRSTLLDVRNPSVHEIRSAFERRGAKFVGVAPGLPYRLVRTHVALWFQK